MIKDDLGLEVENVRRVIRGQIYYLESGSEM